MCMNMYNILYVRVSTESKRKIYDKKSCYDVRGIGKKKEPLVRKELPPEALQDPIRSVEHSRTNVLKGGRMLWPVRCTFGYFEVVVGS